MVRVIDIFMLACSAILSISIVIYCSLCIFRIFKKRMNKMKFTLIKIEKKETEEPCTICLEGGNQIQLPCGHTFHHDCLYEWFEYIPPTCPVCRRDYTDTLLI